jgi:hypothetical protein
MAALPARAFLGSVTLKRSNTVNFQESRVISDQLGVMSERTSQADRAKKDQQIKVSHPCRYYSHHVKPPEVEVTEIILMNESQKADHKRGFFSDL